MFDALTHCTRAPLLTRASGRRWGPERAQAILLDSISTSLRLVTPGEFVASVGHAEEGDLVRELLQVMWATFAPSLPDAFGYT